MKFKSLLLITSLALATASFGQIGPTPYLSSADSPWTALFGPTFYLENFEDGVLNTPGVTASIGGTFGPAPLADSVDGDDGVINGSGTQGKSFLTANAGNGIRFTFSAGTYGALPTHAGLVWTDGQINGTTRFEAFNGSGASLGVITGNHADSNFSGGTAEDRFYGWTSSGGIGSILISNSGGGGLEVDHLQYGSVPEPGTSLAMGIGVAAAALLRKRK